MRRGPADPDRTAAMEALVAEAKASTAAGAWLPEQVRDLFREDATAAASSRSRSWRASRP
ncbi:hypothetical protein [Dactylosporangium cerinum]